MSHSVQRQEIYSYDPQAKIIIMLRNPVDMMYSMWSQFRYSGNEQIESFEAGAGGGSGSGALAIGIRRAAHCITGLYYRHMVRFSEQVSRYFERFGKERVMVIIFDDFRSDTASVYRAVLEFWNLIPMSPQTFAFAIPTKKCAWLGCRS